MLLSILKFLALGYLALGFQCLVRLQKASSWAARLLNLAGALVVFGLPLGLSMTLFTALWPQTTLETTLVAPTPRSHPTASLQPISAQVVAVADGDSLDVRLADNTIERVRLLGLDAPERGMCFGETSADGARQLLQNQTVTLEADTTLPNRDKFGRLARYVRLRDGRLANQVLIEQGLAFEYTYFTPYDYLPEFRAAEAQAQNRGLGIWADATCRAAVQRPEHLPQTISWQMPPNLTPVTVIRVVDGDTIDVSPGGSIRLIGMDTPETGRCYAQEATQRQKVLTEGQTVFLEADPSQADRDAYGRLLRYVWLPDSRLVNALLIADGYAYEYTFRDPYRYVEAFMQLEHEAHLVGRGLWASTTCAGLAGRRYSTAYESN